MRTPRTEAERIQVGSLRVEIYDSRKALGEAAARAVAGTMRELASHNPTVAVIFATGASQLETLRALTDMPGMPWNQIVGFHMDEYANLPADHPASFRHYLREHLTRRVPLREFHEIDGTVPDIEQTCREYAHLVRSQAPQLCLLGIGENGHLAFNDPPEAHFWDPLDMKVVSLDRTCRQQQVEEGWYSNLDAVPQQALTLTIPALMRVPRLIISVPGRRKESVVKRSLEEPVSTSCPATILRVHSNATVYLDEESAAGLELLEGRMVV